MATESVRVLYRPMNRRGFIQRLGEGTTITFGYSLLSACGGSGDGSAAVGASSPPISVAAPTPTPPPAPSPTPTPAPPPPPTYNSTVSEAELRASYSNVAPFVDQVPVFVSAGEKSARSGTSTFYRIPGITRGKTKIHAFAEARFTNQADTGEVSVVWRTLSGDGSNVSAETILCQDVAPWGDGVARRNNNGNPCPIYDPVNGHLHLLFNRARGDLTEDTQTLPSVNPETAGRMRAAVSTDGDGAEWRDQIGGTVLSLPLDYDRTRAVSGRGSDWRLFMPGPGHGICMPDGTLLAPGWIRLSNGIFRTIIMRYDRPSATWAVSGVVPLDGSNEASLSWSKTGKLIVNARYVGGGGRVVAVSPDHGASWESVTLDRNLPDPGCFASILRAGQRGDPSLILFANPASNSARIDMEIKLSLDEHGTFPIRRRIYANATETVSVSWEGKSVKPVSETHATAYSDLVALDNNTFGLLLEQHAVTNAGYVFSNWVISLVRFNVPWVLQGN